MQAMRHKKIYSRLIHSITLFAFIIALSGCRVTLVPPYNEELESQIVTTAKLTDKLYLSIIDAAADNKAYAVYADKYLEIEAEINSILLKNEARPKNADFIVIIKNLQEHFKQYKNDHKAKKTLSDAELLIYNEELKAFWKPLLVAERALKIGQ